MISLPQISSRALLVAVVGLNLADALLSYVAIRAGVAVEGNPVVTTLGFPGKIALVTVAAGLLYLVRPRALWVPAAGLALVVFYSLIGLAVTI